MRQNMKKQIANKKNVYIFAEDELHSAEHSNKFDILHSLASSLQEIK